MFQLSTCQPPRFQMYPRYEYANLDITSFEQSSPVLNGFDPQPRYQPYDQHTHFLPEIIDHVEAKQKCRVCSLDAHGMHFGVQTCRPCAAFFRRIVVLDLKYTCVSNTQKCNVDGRGRNVCRDCRFKKCITVGMTTDNVQYNRDSHNAKSSGSNGRSKNKKSSMMAITNEHEAAGSNTVKPGGATKSDEYFCSDGSTTTSGYHQLDLITERRGNEGMNKIISDLKYLYVEV